MPVDMLDRLQENKLRGLEELIESFQAAAADGVKDELAAIADFIVDEGLGLRLGLVRFWDYCWTAALAGKVSDWRKEGAEMGSLLNRGAVLLTRAAAVARRGASMSGQEVARLAQFEEQSKAFPVWVEECMARLEMLDRTPKPLDRERIARSQAAFSRGECEPVSDILARLENGGPLVQE